MDVGCYGRDRCGRTPGVCSRKKGGHLHKFIKHFRREKAGVWVCEEPATLNLPQGRIQAACGARFVIGTTFMNVDLAELLDAEYSRQKGGQ